MTQVEQQEKTLLRPLSDNVLVQRLEAAPTLKGGIIIPDTAKKKQEQAKVIAIGPGKTDKTGKNLPMPVSVSDVILMDKYSGQEITLDDQEYIIVKASDIIAIVE